MPILPLCGSWCSTSDARMKRRKCCIATQPLLLPHNSPRKPAGTALTHHYRSLHAAAVITNWNSMGYLLLSNSFQSLLFNLATILRKKSLFQANATPIYGRYSFRSAYRIKLIHSQPMTQFPHPCPYIHIYSSHDSVVVRYTFLKSTLYHPMLFVSAKK